MTTPLVSVIIPNYNYGRFLGGTIESVLGQTYPRVEVIVIDDGSTDESDTVRRRYEGRVQWLTQQRCGVSAARNRGVRESRGELVAFLDADDVWLSEKLNRQVQRWLAEPSLGLVHCGAQIVDEAGAFLHVRLDGLEGWLAPAMLRLPRSPILAIGSGVLVPRSACEAVGGFDLRLTTFADWDFAYRIASRYPIGFVAEALVTIRSHGESMQRNVFAMQHDMLLAYSKVFRNASPDIQRARRQCYGNLYLMLAGSFLKMGRFRKAVPYLLRSLWLIPGSCTAHVLGFPARWLQRHHVLDRVRHWTALGGKILCR